MKFTAITKLLSLHWLPGGVSKRIASLMPFYAPLIALPLHTSAELSESFATLLQVTVVLITTLITLPIMVAVAKKRSITKTTLSGLADAGLLIGGGFLVVAGIQMAATRLTPPFFYFYVGLIPFAALAFLNIGTTTSRVTTSFLYSSGTSAFLFLLWQPHRYFEALLLSFLIGISTTLARYVSRDIAAVGSLATSQQEVPASSDEKPIRRHVSSRKPKNVKAEGEPTILEPLIAPTVQATNFALQPIQRRLFAIALILCPLSLSVLSSLRILSPGLLSCFIPLAYFGHYVIPQLELPANEAKPLPAGLSLAINRATALLGVSIVIGEAVFRAYS
jgi:hypothetical protein